MSAIILHVDSPGGEVAGTSEFADMVYAARGQKPITAYVSDMGCSAAYWIASAADEIVMADTAIVGSIGCVAAMRDPKAGAKSIEFVSSQSPNKRPDPTTERGRAQIQTMVDDLAGVFVEAVARNRGVSSNTILSDFGQGGVFVGSKAVAAGLADRIGSYEDVLTSLAKPAGVLGYAADAGDAGEIIAAHLLESGLDVIEAELITQVPTAVVVPTAEQPKEQIMADTETTVGMMEPSVDLTAELTALRAELATEREAREAAQAASAALAVDNRRRELATLAADWHGPTADHVAFMEQLTPEALGFYTQTMTALHEQVKAGALFQTAGVTGTGNDMTPSQELEARAKSLARESDISYTDAVGRVAAQDPELYAAYRRASQIVSTSDDV